MINNPVLTTIFCLGLLMGLMMVIAIIGTRSRLRDADRIWAQYQRGVYNNWAYPPMSSKVRLLVAANLIAIGITTVLLLGMILVPDLVPRRIGFTVVVIIAVVMTAVDGYLYRMVMRGK